MSTITHTYTQTNVYARHIAAKVSADLKRLQRLYGVNSPTDEEIDDYQKEMELLLNAGYLDTVTYGYRRNMKWVEALKYKAVYGEIVGGEDPGGLRPGTDVSGSGFASFLTYSSSWDLLPSIQKTQFEQTLPFRRMEGEEPGIENGGRWDGSRSYAAGDLGVDRSMITRF